MNLHAPKDQCRCSELLTTQILHLHHEHKLDASSTPCRAVTGSALKFRPSVDHLFQLCVSCKGCHPRAQGVAAVEPPVPPQWVSVEYGPDNALPVLPCEYDAHAVEFAPGG